LEALGLTPVAGADYVSIPLWFDWKVYGESLYGPSIKFQFHFGSIGSTFISTFNDLADVSIPLWFDWKKMVDF